MKTEYTVYIVACVVLAGCGGGGTNLDAVYDSREPTDPPDIEEVECLLECGTCDWPETGGIGETVRVPSLENRATINVNGCGGVAVSEYEIWTAAHCMDNLEWDLERLKVRPGYVISETVCDEPKTAVDVRQIGGDKALITVSEKILYHVPPCGDVELDGVLWAEGYPINYDGGKVPQRLTTNQLNEETVIGDWGGGGSGSPVYMHPGTEDECAAGILVAIDGESTLVIQR